MTARRARALALAATLNADLTTQAGVNAVGSLLIGSAGRRTSPSIPRYGTWSPKRLEVAPPPPGARRAPAGTPPAPAEPWPGPVGSSSSGSGRPGPTSCSPRRGEVLEAARRSGSRGRPATLRRRAGRGGCRVRVLRRPLRAAHGPRRGLRRDRRHAARGRGAGRRGRVRGAREPGRRRAHGRAPPRAPAATANAERVRGGGRSRAVVRRARLGTPRRRPARRRPGGRRARLLGRRARPATDRCWSPSATARSSCRT